MCFQVQCSARVTGGAVEVTLSGLKAADTDLYRCEIEVFYPPPYLRLTGNGTLLHVLGEAPPAHDAHVSLSCLTFPLSVPFRPQAAPTVPGLGDRRHSGVAMRRVTGAMRGRRRSAFLWLCW